jgi:hypothetical protein
MLFRRSFTAVVFIGLGMVGPARADVKMNAFADVVGSSSNTEYTMTWLGNSGKQLSFDGSTRLGLNLNADLADRWDFAGQVVARGYGGPTQQSGYILTADWLFINYRPTDNWLLRAGRQILPVVLFAEQIDVGFTYLWTRLPVVVYSIDPVKSFSGLLGSYTYFFGDLRVSAAFYGGSGLLETLSPGIGGIIIRDEYIRGGYVSVSGDSFKVLATYIVSHPVGTIFRATPGGTQVPVPFDLGTVKSTSLGANVNLGSYEFISEVAQLNSDASVPYKQTGAYGTVAYHFFEGFLTPHITFGKLWTNTPYQIYPDATLAQSRGSEALQLSTDQFTGGINLRVTNSIIAKLEYERDRLAFQDPSLNFGIDTYTLALDAVF